MPSITSLATSLSHNFPDFTFMQSDIFRWSPKDKIIFYDGNSQDTASLLHELAHALLDHTTYTKDIELIEMERDAWDYAVQTLASVYDVVITDNIVQNALDSYRDWLHARSTCPQCKATGVQTKKNEYKCVTCDTHWRVNDARVCALRRYTI